MTLREAGPLWLESRKLFISAVTYRDYSIYVKTLAGFFGELVLAKIGGDLTTTKGNWAQVGNEIGNQSGVVHEARSWGNPTVTPGGVCAGRRAARCSAENSGVSDGAVVGMRGVIGHLRPAIAWDCAR